MKGHSFISDGQQHSSEALRKNNKGGLDEVSEKSQLPNTNTFHSSNNAQSQHIMLSKYDQPIISPRQQISNNDTLQQCTSNVIHQQGYVSKHYNQTLTDDHNAIDLQNKNQISKIIVPSLDNEDKSCEINSSQLYNSDSEDNTGYLDCNNQKKQLNVNEIMNGARYSFSQILSDPSTPIPRRLNTSPKCVKNNLQQYSNNCEGGIIQHSDSLQESEVMSCEEPDEDGLPPINLSTLDDNADMDSIVSAADDENDELIEWDGNKILRITSDIRTSSSSVDNAETNEVSRCLLSLNQSLKDTTSPQHPPSSSISAASVESDGLESMVNFCVYRPHFPLNSLTAGIVIKCRVLILPVPLRQDETLMNTAIASEFFPRLPTVIKGFRVPKNAIIALEFFRADGDTAESAVCEGRVFVPSYLFHLVAAKDLFIPTGSEDGLSHVIRHHNFDSVTVELPLGLCSAELESPKTEADAENHFIFVAEQLAAGYKDTYPIARFSIQAPTRIQMPISVTPRITIRTPASSPRDTTGQQYQQAHSQNPRLSISVSPPNSYRASERHERTEPPVKSTVGRPSVPRLRCLPPPSTSVAISPSEQHFNKKRLHSEVSSQTRDAPRKNEIPFRNVKPIDLHEISQLNRLRDFTLKAFGNTTPLRSSPRFEYLDRKYYETAAAAHGLSRKNEKSTESSLRAATASQLVQQASPRGRPVVVKRSIDHQGNTQSSSLRSKSSTTSSVSIDYHPSSLNSTRISAYHHRSISRLNDDLNLTPWGSPREVHDNESYCAFQSPLPSARARHSMPPTTYRLNESDLSPNYDPFYNRPQEQTNASIHRQTYFPSYQSSQQRAMHQKKIEKPVCIGHYDNLVVRENKKMNKQKSHAKEPSTPLEPYTLEIPSRLDQSLRTRSCKKDLGLEMHLPTPIRSFGIASTNSETKNRQTPYSSRIQSPTKLRTNEHIKRIKPTTPKENQQDVDTHSIVNRGWCSRRHKRKFLRRKLQAILNGLLLDDSLPSRQSSATSSTIASSSIRIEDSIDDEYESRVLECRSCMRRKKHRIDHEQESIKTEGSLALNPEVCCLLKCLFCCCPCFVYPFASLCHWFRATARLHWIKLSNTFLVPPG